ncbi:MAG: hypothetical protein F6J87_21375 [Spirulina sp. SIO3F2]|nr:hypothetical protein [Spirulina sp. SIO3F2]
MASQINQPGQDSCLDNAEFDTEFGFMGDRFELVSAYLDGEVSATQRQQVQQWLDSEPEVQRLHQNLLRLRQSLQTLPVPEPSYDAEDLIAGVFAAEEQRQHRHWWLWGGSVIAAAVGAGALVLGSGGLQPRLVQQVEPERDKLMIAVNQPVVEIPAVAGSNPEANLMLPLNRPAVEIPAINQ